MKVIILVSFETGMHFPAEYVEMCPTTLWLTCTTEQEVQHWIKTRQLLILSRFCLIKIGHRCASVPFQILQSWRTGPTFAPKLRLQGNVTPGFMQWQLC